jgi:hypothetical protein
MQINEILKCKALKVSFPGLHFYRSTGGRALNQGIVIDKK